MYTEGELLLVLDIAYEVNLGSHFPPKHYSREKAVTASIFISLLVMVFHLIDPNFTRCNAGFKLRIPNLKMIIRIARLEEGVNSSCECSWQTCALGNLKT